MTKYVLVQWPESQMLMEHHKFNECLLVNTEGHEEIYNPAYMCPLELYIEIWSQQR